MINREFIKEFDKLRKSIGEKFGDGIHTISLIESEVEIVKDNCYLCIDTSKVSEDEDDDILCDEYEIGWIQEDELSIFWDTLILHEGKLCFYMHSGKHDNACALTIFTNVKQNMYSVPIMYSLKHQEEIN